MKQYIEIRCRHCGTDDLVKNGRSENGTQGYRCNECGKSFQNEYSYNVWKPGVKSQIETQTINSSGVRDIGKNLGISKNTVISELKKTPAEVNPQFISQADGIEIEIKMDAEADELWSYVCWKKNQRWIQYAVERKTGVLLAWHNGRRTDESCALLMAKLSAFPASVIILMIDRVTGSIFRHRNIFRSYAIVVQKRNVFSLMKQTVCRMTHSPVNCIGFFRAQTGFDWKSGNMLM